MSNLNKEEYDFIVGFTLFTPKGFRTMYRHFDNLEIAEMFASNVNIKDNHKIYVDLDLYNKEKEKNKELNAKRIRDISGIKNYVSKDKIREKIKECEKEYQIYVGREYTGMNDLIVKIKTLQELLEE